jgi:hypothetical protein
MEIGCAEPGGRQLARPACYNSQATLTTYPGYDISQLNRKRVEEIVGWLKTVGMLRKTRHKGLPKSRLGPHLRPDGLQPGQNPQPHGGTGVKKVARSLERATTERTKDAGERP